MIEQEAACALMQEATKPLPSVLARLVDPADPLRGVVFTEQNQYHVSELIFRLATEALGADPRGIKLHKNYEDPDARPDIAYALKLRGTAEIVHEASKVRVRVTLGSDGYSLQIPGAESLTPNQRHRARSEVSERTWSLCDSDLGSGDGEWGYTVDRGGVPEAVDATTRLLRLIAECGEDAELSVRY